MKMIENKTLLFIFKQIDCFRNDLHFSKQNRKRNDLTDKDIIIHLQIWIRSYCNGLYLKGWLK